MWKARKDRMLTEKYGYRRKDPGRDFSMITVEQGETYSATKYKMTSRVGETVVGILRGGYEALEMSNAVG